MTVNKARMTFRFNEESSRQLDVAQEEQKSAPQKPKEARQDNPRLGHSEDKHAFWLEHTQEKESVKKNRDHLNVIPGPMQGWSDPFHKDDPWSEMLAGPQPYQEEDDKQYDQQYDQQNDGYEYDFDPYDRYVEHTDDLHNLADAVYPELVDATYRPRRPSSPWKIIGTVTGAIVTGALFGFVVLSFFKDGSGASLSPVKTSTENVAKAPAEADKAAPVAVQVQRQSYYMLQYGVFSSGERVLQAQKELQQLGIAAGADPDQENRVYAGMSTDQEQAKLFSNQLKAQGLDLYVREISLPAASEMTFVGGADTVNEYFTVSSELVSKLSQLSAGLLGQENPAALDAENTKVLTDLHSRWLEVIKRLQTGLGPDETVIGTNLEQTMNSAISAITEYNRNRSKGHLWEVQAGMMQYILQQKELISKLGRV
ncbi:SPOR domain-containing protein [Paenibacillus sp. HJL G12]|uniref:SPOR domain-containing protein n=1 Tax=Paenibacillus dendrobii TaxID=2691084 RepID=A0A7X3LKQ7_9BACL|nr:SPOR domain-containing protein [Paenibacillus dendrobii]MWV46729.1 SPOR domain-containing protein [Paenibacillus dendrobii]